MNIFVFDIETVPDVDSGRRIHNLANLDDTDTAQAMYAMQRDKNGTEFLPHHLHKIVAISAVFCTIDSIRVWSLGTLESDEAELIQRFYHGLDKYTPTLVSWNGSGFDLPVLHYRSLLHQVSAPRYWETGDHDSNFRWNNYLNRYHYRHLDLMEVLAAYQHRAFVPLDQIAVMLGLPGKMGMSGANVWTYYQQGKLEAIRNYCETDVLNTYLVYLQFELIRGNLSNAQYQQQRQRLMDYLASQSDAHFMEFLQEIA